MGLIRCPESDPESDRFPGNEIGWLRFYPYIRVWVRGLYLFLQYFFFLGKTIRPGGGSRLPYKVLLSRETKKKKKYTLQGMEVVVGSIIFRLGRGRGRERC